MGNLRSNRTDKEWDDLEIQIKKDRLNGKPDDLLLNLSMEQRCRGFRKNS